MNRYRTGRHLGRTVYRDDRLIGVMDTAEDGALVVELLNARERVQVARARNADEDRNARAYGWEVGRGQPIGAVIQSSPDNPFLDPDWAGGVDHEALGYQGKLSSGGPTPGPSNHGATP